MDRYYAGIGSRYEVPEEVLQLMFEIGGHLQLKRLGLRSGGAIGCDQAFEKGCDIYGGPVKQILRPRDATLEAIEMARRLLAPEHWANCNDYARRLLGRNCQIILGKELDDPVQFVICYTKDETSGGTSLGIKVARANHIHVYNLAKLEDFNEWAKKVAR